MTAVFKIQAFDHFFSGLSFMTSVWVKNLEHISMLHRPTNTTEMEVGAWIKFPLIFLLMYQVSIFSSTKCFYQDSYQIIYK